MTSRAEDYRAPPGRPGELGAVGVTVAARLDKTGIWTWAAATPEREQQGQVIAASLTEADELIAADLGQVLPGQVANYSLLPYRRIRRTSRGKPRPGKGDRHRNSQIASIRPWEKLPTGHYLPACDRLLSDRSAADKTWARRAVSLRYTAQDLLSATAVHPAMRSIQIPSTGQFPPWTVATDGSLRDGTAAWAFVTGAGWTDTDSLHDGASSSTAEFAAYCHALAIYPDNAEVTLITDSVSTGAFLQEIAEAARPGQLGRHLQQDVRPADITQSVFDRTVLHARRLRLTVQWSRRNTHPLQAAAHRMCGQTSQQPGASGPADPSWPATDATGLGAAAFRPASTGSCQPGRRTSRQGRSPLPGCAGALSPLQPPDDGKARQDMNKTNPYASGFRRTALLIGAAQELAAREGIPYEEAAGRIALREDEWRWEELAARQWSPARETTQAAGRALRHLADRVQRRPGEQGTGP